MQIIITFLLYFIIICVHEIIISIGWVYDIIM